MAKKELLGIYIEKELKEKVDALAKDCGVKTSFFVRRVLEFTIQNYDEHLKIKASRESIGADETTFAKLKAEIKSELKKEMEEKR